MLKLDTFHIFIFSFILSCILCNVVVCLTYPVLYSWYTFLLYFMLFFLCLRFRLHPRGWRCVIWRCSSQNWTTVTMMWLNGCDTLDAAESTRRAANEPLSRGTSFYCLINILCFPPSLSSRFVDELKRLITKICKMWNVVTRMCLFECCNEQIQWRAVSGLL